MVILTITLLSILLKCVMYCDFKKVLEISVEVEIITCCHDDT